MITLCLGCDLVVKTGFFHHNLLPSLLLVAFILALPSHLGDPVAMLVQQSGATSTLLNQNSIGGNGVIGNGSLSC